MPERWLRAQRARRLEHRCHARTVVACTRAGGHRIVVRGIKHGARGGLGARQFRNDVDGAAAIAFDVAGPAFRAARAEAQCSELLDDAFAHRSVGRARERVRALIAEHRSQRGERAHGRERSGRSVRRQWRRRTVASGLDPGQRGERRQRQRQCTHCPCTGDAHFDWPDARAMKAAVFACRSFSEGSCA